MWCGCGKNSDGGMRMTMSLIKASYMVIVLYKGKAHHRWVFWTFGKQNAKCSCVCVLGGGGTVAELRGGMHCRWLIGGFFETS